MKRPLAMTFALLVPVAAAAQSSDGIRWYRYGELNAVVYCRPLYISDIKLAPGEEITTVALGDSARWIAAKGASGPHADTAHVFVKPGEFATDTNLEILTDRHEYMLRLVNDAQRYTPRVAFYDTPSVAARPTRTPAPLVLRRRPAIPLAAVPSPASTARPRLARAVLPASVPNRVAASPALLPAPPTLFATPQPSGRSGEYAVNGPIAISHDLHHTYVSVHGQLKRELLVFASDPQGWHLVHADHRGSTYALAGVLTHVSVWRGFTERASAVRIASARSAATASSSPAQPSFTVPSPATAGEHRISASFRTTSGQAVPRTTTTPSHTPLHSAPPSGHGSVVQRKPAGPI